MKYKIQTRLQKKETEMMEKLTKKFKTLTTNKSLKSHETAKQDQVLDDNESDESEDLDANN